MNQLRYPDADGTDAALRFKGTSGERAFLDDRQCSSDGVRDSDLELGTAPGPSRDSRLRY